MILDMSDEDIVDTLADDNLGAISVLTAVLTKQPHKFRTLALDLEDMQMSGEQIWVAYKDYCDSNVTHFVDCCEKRDANMVATVNKFCTGKTARAHGEQKTLPKVDEAVAGLLKDAENSGNLKRLDEGAEAIHLLFKTMLNEMQHTRVFTANFRLNLDGAGWAKFAVALVELQNPDGSPYKIQPKDEVANMATQAPTAQKAEEQATLGKMAEVLGVAHSITETGTNVTDHRGNVSITPGTGVDNKCQSN